jgi:hypothetical protein
MRFTTIVLLMAGLVLGMLLLLELGRRIGIRRRRSNQGVLESGTGVVDAAIFGLMGLLVAFIFSGSASRFEVRRDLIVDEANAISTAYLRLDLLPPDRQPELREKFRLYVRSRIAVYRTLSNFDSARSELARSQALQNEIWRQALAASKETGSPAVMTLVLSNLNEVIDITTTRTAALQRHMPPAVFILLACTTLASSLLAGYNMSTATRNWMHIFAFVLLLSATVYLIIDLEYPRIGLIRVDALDELLADALKNMS